MVPEIREKYEKLKNLLVQLESVVIAFSGGVDSSLILKAAMEVLPDKLLAVNIHSVIHSQEEFKDAKELAENLKVPFLVIETNVLEIDSFANNPSDRCYHCKKAVFSLLEQIKNGKGFKTIVEGSNLDDLKDYRPGRKALEELEVRSPLLEVGFAKREIRLLAKELGLPNWNKPSLACLASRFPYNTLITGKGLRQVEEGERFLRLLGIEQMRVRHHGEIARIEVLPEQMNICLENRERIEKEFASLGFPYAALDLKGYRTGSMNETLS